MNAPRISWQILEEITANEYEYTQYKTYTEEGSFVPGDYIEKTIQIWNNYLGIDDVQDAENCTLVITFKSFEDAFLLSLLEVEVEGSVATLEMDVDRAVIDLGNISGVANSGSTLNGSNFRTVKFRLGPIPSNIRNELKSMYFYIEYVSE